MKCKKCRKDRLSWGAEPDEHFPKQQIVTGICLNCGAQYHATIPCNQFQFQTAEELGYFDFRHKGKK